MNIALTPATVAAFERLQLALANFELSKREQVHRGLSIAFVALNAATPATPAQ